MPSTRQRHWTAFLIVGAMALGLAPRATARGGDISSNIHDYVASKLDDISADLHLVKYDAEAGRQISKDFGLIYNMMQKTHSDLKFLYKEPDKMRLDGRFGASNGTFIVNETHQIVRLGLGLNEKRELGDTPGKRKTLLDVGLISDDYLSYTQAEFQGSRPFNGVMCAVFNISYRDKTKDTSHRVIWIDPKTKVTLKREEYSQEGKLRSIWYYHDPYEVAPGIFMPATIEIDDSDGQLAGETAYKNVKVNQGLPDSLFK